MTFNFDKAFHKPSKSVPRDCPCRQCDESKYYIDNPYDQSTKCEECKIYIDWRNSSEQQCLF